MPVAKNKALNVNQGGLGSLLNRIQTLFVGMLRIWSIPIVLMLSIASGFTTYYGLSHFIVPWIALIITIAIQSIIVICSLEIAGIHWKANRLRYLSVLLSLSVAIMASITFSYFKFYEVSASELGQLVVEQVEEEIIPITQQNTPPPPPPPPPAAPEIIQVVENEAEVAEVQMVDTEADATTVVEEFEVKEEVVEEEIFLSR